MKKIGWMLSVVAALFAAGCATPVPVEDPAALTECASEIVVLQDKTLSANSEAKHRAALAVADRIDFSYTRNVKTLLKIFAESDAHVSEDGRLLVFSYPYRQNDIQFRFRCSGVTVVTAEVVRK